MALIDSILNLVALLLWLNWRSIRIERQLQPPPAALKSTSKRVQARPGLEWMILGALPLLLLARAWIYWQLGSVAEWTPKLDLAVVVLSFRSERFTPALLYSVLGFVRLWALFYFWLFSLVVLNRRAPEPDSLLRMIRLHLGWVARWPWLSIWLVAPVVMVTALWLAIQPLLVYVHTALPAPALATRVEQGLLVSVGLFLSLKYLLSVILFIHLVLTYVYVGRSPVWDFISLTARNLLRPLKGMQYRRVDFAPVVGVALLFLLLHGVPWLIWTQLYRHHLPVWPQ